MNKYAIAQVAQYRSFIYLFDWQNLIIPGWNFQQCCKTSNTSNTSKASMGRNNINWFEIIYCVLLRCKTYWLLRDWVFKNKTTDDWINAASIARFNLVGFAYSALQNYTRISSELVRQLHEWYTEAGTLRKFYKIDMLSEVPLWSR